MPPSRRPRPLSQLIYHSASASQQAAQSARAMLGFGRRLAAEGQDSHGASRVARPDDIARARPWLLDGLSTIPNLPSHVAHGHDPKINPSTYRHQTLRHCLSLEVQPHSLLRRRTRGSFGPTNPHRERQIHYDRTVAPRRLANTVRSVAYV